MATTAKTTQDVKVKLVGTDGNVFSIIGKINDALNKAGFRTEAREFANKAFEAGSYDEVLQLAMRTVDVH